MFFRVKTVGPHSYVQLVENHREDGHHKQRVLLTLGSLDELKESGQIDALLASGSRLSESMLVLTEHQRGELTSTPPRRFGTVLAFERLWVQTGCRDVIQALADERKFSFSLERAVFLTVLHRLLASGSDRGGVPEWQEDYQIEGLGGLQLHHLYRAMAWLGEELPGARAGRRNAVRTPLRQGPDRGGAVRPPPRPLHRAGTGLLRHHLDLLRGRGRRDARPARAQQGPSARPEADGRRDGAGRRRAADLLRAVAGQHHRRDDTDPGRGPPADVASESCGSASWPTGA